ncbi:MAG TPA: 5-oxoprolinase subunit PxpA [Bauldia sp.]|nr:5-oxoprolinase subunit PxpA [Bauldia sp.]
MLRFGVNVDCGESYGRLVVGQDEAVLPHVTSANIACGFHGGDPSTIRRTVRLAKRYGVACGAHPSLPDLMGFGRREMNIAPDEFCDLIIYQLGAVKALIESEGQRCVHVKPHGVMYAMLEREDLASAFADAVIAVDPEMAWICEANSRTAALARARGLRIVTEFTADRAYDRDGKLVITRNPEPVDPAFVVGQVRQVVETGSIATNAGTRRPVSAEIICMHSDTPNSADIARAIRGYLESLS